MRLDFAQLDTKAPDLDLIIIAPQVLDITVRQPAAQIAASVHPHRRLSTERVIQETLRRQFRQIEIATGNPRTADINLAADPDGHWLAVHIQQVNPCIRDRTADRKHRRPITVDILNQSMPGHHVAALRGPITVNEFRPRLGKHFQSGELNRLSAQYHPANAV
ncbi:hypothetical protein ALO86_200087 [Pseudomonas syringae pv. berberidis]|nr:hypothetical protein ALO86_200087 [Pseudomonas syringae pv. berberidis]